MTECLSLIHKALQVETVGVFLNHVNFVGCLNCRVVFYAKLTLKHAIDFDFFFDSLNIISGDELVAEHFACKDFL